MPVCIDNCLSDRRRADVPYMKWFSDIGADIVNHHCFIIYRFLFSRNVIKYIRPSTIREKEVHVPTHNRYVFEVLGVFSESFRDFFRDCQRGEPGYFRIRKYTKSEVAQFFFRRYIERDSRGSDLRKARNHNI